MADENPDACDNADRHFAYKTVYGDLRFCGCGNPEEVLEVVLDVLRHCPLHSTRWQPDKRVGSVGYEMLLYQMDAAELIEHGGSIGGSWITDKGSRFLAVMDGKDDEYLEDVGYSGSCCPATKEA